MSLSQSGPGTGKATYATARSQDLGVFDSWAVERLADIDAEFEDETN